jgi:heme-degrading monooxygenase HmoA
MVAQVVTFAVDEGAMDTLISRYQDVIAPAALARPGFAGMLLLINRESGRALALSLWDTRADLLAWEAGAPQASLASAAQPAAAAVAREEYDVGMHAEVTEEGVARIRGI